MCDISGGNGGFKLKLMLRGRGCFVIQEYLIDLNFNCQFWVYSLFHYPEFRAIGITDTEEQTSMTIIISLEDIIVTKK